MIDLLGCGHLEGYTVDLEAVVADHYMPVRHTPGGLNQGFEVYLGVTSYGAGADFDSYIPLLVMAHIDHSIWVDLAVLVITTGHAEFIFHDAEINAGFGMGVRRTLERYADAQCK